MHDVVVIGAGPAGATAAFALCEAGFSVLILEKENLPRRKPCAGALAVKGWRYLPAGLSEFPNPSYRFFEAYHRGRRRAVLGGRSFAVPVERDLFDAELVSLAERAGATLRAGDPVTDIEWTGELVRVRTAAGMVHEAWFMIGADGANGPSRRALGLPPLRRGVALEGEIPRLPTDPDPETVLVEFSPSFGYGWIFPKGDRLSVGIASFRPHRRDLRRSLRETLAPHLAPERLDVPLRGHPLPLGHGRGPFAGPGGLVAGDAAGLCDPLTGEGLYYALKSGRLAAEAAALYLRRAERWREEYERSLAEGPGRALDLARKAAAMFYGLPRPAKSWLLGREGLGDRFLATLESEDGYVEAYAWAVEVLSRFRGWTDVAR